MFFSHHAHPGRKPKDQVHEEEVPFSEDEVLYIRALSEWSAAHASGLLEVRTLRETVLGGSPVSTEELLIGIDDSVTHLSSKEREAVIAKYIGDHPVPIERTLTKEEALQLIKSPAAAILSLDQFRQWGIPVVDHKVRLGLPAGSYKPSELGSFDGLCMDLTFEPSGDTFRIRIPRALVMDGFKVVQGKDAPAYPASRWRAKSREDFLSLTAATMGEHDPKWFEEYLGQEPADIEQVKAIRRQRDEDKVVKPTQRQLHLPFMSALHFPDRKGRCTTVQVWPGSVLDEVRAISEELAELYHWDKAEATWFLLTGERPVVRPLRSTTTRRHKDWFTDAVTSMEILPWVSRGTLSKLYRQVQRRLIGDNRKRDPVTIEVFRFVTKEAGVDITDDDPCWRELAEKWNREHPKREFLPRYLHQAYKRARQSLLHPCD